MLLFLCSIDFSDCQICSPNADCVRISEEMISCRCFQGYEGDGTTCTSKLSPSHYFVNDALYL